MIITLFSDKNIAQLSNKDRKSLLMTYRHSYKNSIWSEISPEVRKWYESNESNKWFKDARDFYMAMCAKGSSSVALTEDVRTGEIIAAIFTINGDLFLEHSDDESRSIVQHLLKEIGAEASETVYVGELFVKPKYRGASGGTAIVKMTSELHAQLSKRGIKHVISWTLDSKKNEMLHMYQKIGLQEVPDGRHANGVDVFKKDQQNGGQFSKSLDGPAIYFYCTMDQMAHYLTKYHA